MRQFKLINQSGQEIDLNGEMWLTEPQGWGFANDNKYEEVDGFYIPTKKGRKQVEKKGLLTFLPPNPYADYRRFVDFVSKAESLVLEYNPDGERFYVDVDFMSISKTELTKYRALECEIVVAPLSPLRTEYNMNISITNIVGQSKTYTGSGYEYPYSYRGNVSGVASIQIDAQMPCDWAFEIIGGIEAPVVSVLQEGNLIARVDLSTITLDEGEKVIFSTVAGVSGATLIADDTITDLTDSLELTAGIPIFAKLPIGVPLDIIVEADNVQTETDILCENGDYLLTENGDHIIAPYAGESKFTIYRYYRSV